MKSRNHKKRKQNYTTKHNHRGQGKQGRRAYDGTMDGPFRSSRGRV